MALKAGDPKNICETCSRKTCEQLSRAAKKNNISEIAEAEWEFCSHIKKELTLMQRADISDMFEPIMSNKCAYPFDIGHGAAYWKNRDNGKEGFAEMYSAIMTNPESLEQIKRFFPKSYKIFLEMLEVVK